jgi:hypothetical protein
MNKMNGQIVKKVDDDKYFDTEGVLGPHVDEIKSDLDIYI